MKISGILNTSKKLWRQHWKLLHSRSPKMFPILATSLG